MQILGLKDLLSADFLPKNRILDFYKYPRRSKMTDVTICERKKYD